jgi:aminopeptidase N
MLKPLHYDLQIEPNLNDFTFEGRVDIRFESTEPAQEIILNCLELAIWECAIKGREKWQPCTFCLLPEKETLRISLPTPVTGIVDVRVTYTGQINDKMAGFYRSAYTVDGSTRHIAVTQFQESDARRALPCMDHPMYKATFDIEIITPPGLTAISNNAVTTQETLDNGKKAFRFERTPRMSTYLLFFGVGEFETLQDEQDRRVMGIALPGLAERLAFGVKFGRQALQYCESYYGIPYPLTKMDLIAIPDFAFGAMENWGAITFRENLLLHDSQSTSAMGEQRICEVIAHEIAHQWFGNLVTPEDWKYLWLNESFATYFGFGVVDHYYPEWDTWGQFLQGQTDTAMVRDALRETIPIEIPGGKHVVINTSTAPIIYSKGGSLLRQIQGYIGADNFRSGLQHYLHAHQYACASSHHLWEAFEAASDQPVTTMVEQWVMQPGFPLVEAHREGNNLTLAQKRFTYLPDTSDTLWPIPVVMDLFSRGRKALRQTITLDQRHKTIVLDDDVEAFKINAGQTGFYRTRYTASSDVEALVRLISDQDMAPEDRWGVQNDLFAMVRAGLASMNDYLTLLDCYDKETADLPLTSIDANLFAASLVLEHSWWSCITQTGRAFTNRTMERIGYEPRTGEAQATSILREQMLWHAALYGDEGAMQFTAAQFNAFAENGSIHPDLARSVMQAGMLQGGEKAFRFLCQRLETTDSEHERMNILMALGSQKNPDLIRETCDYTLEHVPDRNRFIPLVSLCLNPHAIPLMWDWFLAHVQELESFHPLLYERVIAGIVPFAGMKSPEAVNDFFMAYMKKHPQTIDVVKLSLEKLEINLAMRTAAGRATGGKSVKDP